MRGATLPSVQHERALRAITIKLEGLYDGVAEGLRTPGLLGRIGTLEAEKARLETGLSRPEPSPVRLHPNLSELYRAKVSALQGCLTDPSIRDEAIGILRGLIEQVILRDGECGWELEIHGELEALVALGLTREKAARPAYSLRRFVRQR